MTEEERAARRKQFEERMKNMSPEERAQWEQRMQGRGRGEGGRGGAPGGSRQGAPRPDGGQQRAQGGQSGQRPSAGSGQAGSQAQANEGSILTRTHATTVDALFAPLPPTEGRGRVWLYINKQLKSVNVHTGVTDGTWTEIIESPDTAQLQPNTELVINVVTGLEPVNRPGQQGQGSPLMPQRGNQPGRGNPGGGGGGRGR